MSGFGDFLATMQKRDNEITALASRVQKLENLVGEMLMLGPFGSDIREDEWRQQARAALGDRRDA